MKGKRLTNSTPTSATFLEPQKLTHLVVPFGTPGSQFHNSPKPDASLVDGNHYGE
jgi:hypothetical protein